MNRVVLILVALALALALGGWLLFRKETPEPVRAGSGSAAAPTTSTGLSPGPAPSLPNSVDSAHAVPPPTPATEYEIGGIRVRDHRSGSNAPLDVPPNVHRPNTRELPSTLTQAVAQQVRGVLSDCAKDLPKDARGQHPRLEGQIIVAIKDHKLTVTSATMQLRDVTGDAGDATRQCVEHKAVGLQTPAVDQDDLDNYSIGVTFAVL